MLWLARRCACYTLSMKIGIAFIFLTLTACASSREPYMLPLTDLDSQAPAAAYAADGFTFRKAMPDRRGSKPWEFYYKHCSESGSQMYFSKTSYDCTGPYY